MKKNRKKLLLAGVACALELGCAVPTYAVYGDYSWSNVICDYMFQGSRVHHELNEYDTHIVSTICNGINHLGRQLDREIHSVNSFWKQLIPASGSGNLQSVIDLICDGANVNVIDKNGNTALMAAAEKGHISIVNLLIGQDAKINSKNFEGKTALMLAAKNSKWKVCSLLIENGAKVTPDCHFILAKIAGEGNLDAVKLLLKEGVDINAKDKGGNTALVNAAANGKWDMVDFLYKQGAVINEDSRAALIDAVKKGDYKLVKFLIDNGAKVNVSDANGTTALMWASYIGNMDLIKFLIDCGADINAKNQNGDIAFVFAARDFIKEDGKKVNKDVGAVINILNSYKPESIYKPIARPVNKKIERSNPMNPQNNRGAGLDIRDPNGDTALIMAARINNLDMVKFLINSGADPTITNKEGYTALMYATKNNNFEMVKLLTELDGTKISRKQCNICWDTKEANKFAYIFKCGEKYGHHVCKECLQKIVHGKENPKCPICQQEAIAEKIMEFLKEQGK